MDHGIGVGDCMDHGIGSGAVGMGPFIVDGHGEKSTSGAPGSPRPQPMPWCALDLPYSP